ncbi:DUF2599 domain-containing protein [Pseudomonas wadenswilerensis]
MRVLTRASCRIALLGGLLTPLCASAAPGDEVAAQLTADYQFTPDRYSRDQRVRDKALVERTGSDSQPAFLCSGNLLRAVWADVRYPFWSVSPKSQVSGGVSGSYLRADANFSKLAYGLSAGFFFYPIYYNPKPYSDYNVLCFFPKDAATDLRSMQGCGDSKDTAPIEDYCSAPMINVSTAAAWADRYLASGYANLELCGFDVRDSENHKAGPEFVKGLEARNLAIARYPAVFDFQNEFRIAKWTENPPLSPPVMAIFHTYDAASENLALSQEHGRLFQIQWYRATREHKPIIKLNLPETLQNKAVFAYHPEDQAILSVTAPDSCQTFLKRSEWGTERRTPYVGTPMDSLQIELSDCAKTIGIAQVDNLFNEIVARHYLDRQWGDYPVNTGNTAVDEATAQAKSYARPVTILSNMRNQLLCQLKLNPRPALLTLEPKRPDVTSEAILQGRCNPA